MSLITEHISTVNKQNYLHTEIILNGITLNWKVNLERFIILNFNIIKNLYVLRVRINICIKIKCLFILHVFNNKDNI